MVWFLIAPEMVCAWKFLWQVSSLGSILIWPRFDRHMIYMYFRCVEWFLNLPRSLLSVWIKKDNQFKKKEQQSINTGVQLGTSTPFLTGKFCSDACVFQARERDPTASCDDLVPENGRLGSGNKTASLKWGIKLGLGLTWKWKESSVFIACINHCKGHFWGECSWSTFNDGNSFNGYINLLGQWASHITPKTNMTMDNQPNYQYETGA